MMSTFNGMGALLFLGFLGGLKVCCDHIFKFFKYYGLQLGLKTPLSAFLYEYRTLMFF